MNFLTLNDILYARRTFTERGITFVNGDNGDILLSYASLYDKALKSLSALQQHGIKPGDELVFQVEDNETFVITFWACILGGIIPVPVSVGPLDENRIKLLNIWQLLNRPNLLISRQSLEKLEQFFCNNELTCINRDMVDRVILEDQLLAETTYGQPYNSQEHDIAFIQFSSGSTGTPKGVVLTHKNLITNIMAIGAAAGYTDNDRMMSWMPLSHDMGLIGFHLSPVLFGMQHFLLPTSFFVRKPLQWLEKADEYQVSILCSPNFGYKYILKHIRENSLQNCDLSQVRIIYNGAEPISATLCYKFTTEMARYGLKKNAMCPVYGLAEASVAVTISAPEAEIKTIGLVRNKMQIGSKVVATNADNIDQIMFVNLGTVINDSAIRITNKEGEVLGENYIGHLQIKGDNVTKGYYNNEAATKATIMQDGWLKTGDIGFINNDSLFITGRAKDIIFVNGQNYYPHDVERVAEGVSGIELNKIAVAGYFNSKTQRDEIIAFVVHRGRIEKFIPLAEALKGHISTQIGISLDHVVPVMRIPKTTSGKLRRFRLLEMYQAGDFDTVLKALNNYLSDQLVELDSDEDANGTEEMLLSIFRTVLNRQKFNTVQHFFQSGGTSLKAATLAMLIGRRLQVDLPLQLIYENPTVKQLSVAIKRLNKYVTEPIPQAPVKEFYPVSIGQRRLYYAWQLDNTATFYNIPVAFRITGQLVVEKLETCIRQIIERHDSLRMTFHLLGEPMMKVHDQMEFNLSVQNCSSTDLAVTIKSCIQPFNLETGPLLRVYIFQTAPGEQILLIDMHHIIADGVSIYNLIKELFATYEGNQLDSLSIQYRDYVNWSADTQTPEQYWKQRDFWLNHLGSALPVLEMPIDFQRPPVFNSIGGKLPFEIDEEYVKGLKRLASKYDCSLHILLFTIYNILLSKYTGQESIIVGIPVARRSHPDLVEMIGMFVNNLALKSNVERNLGFLELLEKQKRMVTTALQHQDFPFDNLVSELSLKPNADRNPVFDTMFIYQNMGDVPRKLNNCLVSPFFLDPGTARFDISLEIFESGDQLHYNVEYASRLFTKATAEQFGTHFRCLIANILAVPGARVEELSVMSPAEVNNCLYKYNDTAAIYPHDQCIHHLFETQVVRTPQETAIVFNEEILSYQQLNDKADRVSARLISEGVKPGSIVGVLLDRSPEQVISILGILKAGCCFLPIDISLPEERINYLLDNSRCSLLITIPQLEIGIIKGVKVLYISDLPSWDLIEVYQATATHSNDLAYIIYTSGTTGNPKGVKITHRSLVNYISWTAKAYLDNLPGDFPLYTSISFDLTITSIFTPLITGNKLIIYQDNDRQLLIERVISDNKVDIVKLTPSHLKVLVEKGNIVSRVKKFIVGGERLDTSLAAAIYRNFGEDVTIYNEYGPTEATVGCMFYEFDPTSSTASVPIGRPVDNMQIYLLDKARKPVPVNVPGEIFVAGDGVAAGYLFNDSLTIERFIDNPFTPGGKMYKTGDVARRLPDGNIEYIGRFDRQIKLNGYRIELGEIERKLAEHTAIDEALVVLKNGDLGQPLLIAYYKTEDEVKGRALRYYLAERLPHYMIPAQFIAIDNIPLTRNGKVAYDSLPVPSSRIEDEEAESIDTETIATMLIVWKSVLGIKQLSVADNFFELGGDSIKAVQIASMLYDKGIQVNVKDILIYQTIIQISFHTVNARVEVSYEQGIVTGNRILSPIESWFFSREFHDPGYYNQSVLLRLKRKPDIDLLAQTFTWLIRQHDGLRANYHSETGELYYNNKHLDQSFKVGYYINTEEGPETQFLIQICNMVRMGMDLSESLLLKAAVIVPSTEEELLFITAHHLLVDGVSWRILLEDFYHVYTTLEKRLSLQDCKKTASMLDWGKKLKDFTSIEHLSSEQDYWSRICDFSYSIPKDFTTDQWEVRHMGKVSAALPEERTTFLLTEANTTYNTDTQVILCTALAVALKEWTGSDTCKIEMENFGRHLDIDTSRTVGWFTAMYPVLLTIDTTLPGEQIRSVKEQLREIPHHGMGYGILECANDQLNSRIDNISEIRLNYLGQFGVEMDNELFTYSNRETGLENSPDNKMSTSLEMNLMVNNGVLNLELSYNRKAYKEETIQWFASTFMERLTHLLAYLGMENELYFTPSDFDSAGLTQEEIDLLF